MVLSVCVCLVPGRSPYFDNSRTRAYCAGSSAIGLGGWVLFGIS